MRYLLGGLATLMLTACGDSTLPQRADLLGDAALQPLRCNQPRSDVPFHRLADAGDRDQPIWGPCGDLVLLSERAIRLAGPDLRELRDYPGTLVPEDYWNLAFAPTGEALLVRGADGQHVERLDLRTNELWSDPSAIKSGWAPRRDRTGSLLYACSATGLTIHDGVSTFDIAIPGIRCDYRLSAATHAPVLVVPVENDGLQVVDLESRRVAELPVAARYHIETKDKDFVAISPDGSTMLVQPVREIDGGDYIDRTAGDVTIVDTMRREVLRAVPGNDLLANLRKLDSRGHGLVWTGDSATYVLAPDRSVTTLDDAYTLLGWHGGGGLGREVFAWSGTYSLVHLDLENGARTDLDPAVRSVCALSSGDQAVIATGNDCHVGARLWTEPTGWIPVDGKPLWVGDDGSHLVLDSTGSLRLGHADGRPSIMLPTPADEWAAEAIEIGPRLLVEAGDNAYFLNPAEDSFTELPLHVSWPDSQPQLGRIAFTAWDADGAMGLWAGTVAE